MKKINEVIGDSFYQYLSNLPDLVLIMDDLIIIVQKGEHRPLMN